MNIARDISDISPHGQYVVLESIEETDKHGHANERKMDLGVRGPLRCPGGRALMGSPERGNFSGEVKVCAHLILIHLCSVYT